MTPTRQAWREAAGVLLVLRTPPPAPPPSPGQPPIVAANPAEGPEVLLALRADGTITALAGHVDLGTGIGTAYAQIVAEELGVQPQDVTVVLGHTASAPNQGPTIASTSIQIHAQPLRVAAAQAGAWLLARAAQHWGVEAAQVQSGRGCLRGPHGQQLAWADLLGQGHVELMLDLDTPTRPVADYTVVGTSAPRQDVPAKVVGEGGFVHDWRVPGMLHGRVIRPPYAGLDAGDFVGRSLLSVDESSIAHLPGIERIVTLGDFVGVVAQREEQAEAAMHALVVHWAPHTPVAPLDDVAQAISQNPSTPRQVHSLGDVDAALDDAAVRLDRQYVWPYQLHASIGPSCAVADWQGERATVWAGTQNPHVLRADLSRLTGLPDTAIDVVRLEASGCYGRNGADDVAADALLLSRAVGRPVRVQLTREQEHAWEPKGAAQLMSIQGGLDAQGAPLAYNFATSYPSNGAPTLALLLTGTVPAVAKAFEMGDRTSVPPYAYPHQRITVHDMAPILRASWLRGVSALPNSFAHESYIDELAHEAGVDPVAYRLRHLPDERAAELVQATAQRAGWVPHTQPRMQAVPGADSAWVQGQGFAYARYVHSKFPGFGAAWAAWVADVQVNRDTGEVNVSRVVVGHDAGLMINPQGVAQQVQGNVLQTTSRALKEQARVDPDTRTVTSREWGSYPILNFREVPVVDVMLMPRPGEPPLGAGESASVPGTAAIANAIFDATGVRLRQPPFTPEVVRAALHPLSGPSAQPPAEAPVARPPAQARNPARLARSIWALSAALLAAGAGLLAGMVGWRSAIAPVTGAPTGVYSAATIERGRQLAALGNCEHCHTAEGGLPWAGGRPVDTPFGMVKSTNLTADVAHGLGAWSYPAFERAMRQGVSRDGHWLYPAFPYTSFTQASDADLTALYAYLQTLAPVAQATPAATMRFPFNQRWLMAGWNALWLQAGPAPAVPGRSAQWQRGAELVNGLGHCTACHSPRGALGAEQASTAYLAGARVNGWDAPPLGALSRSPVPWTEAALVQYLRKGHHAHHGVAGGSMAPVVRGLAAADDADVRAMAHYLVSLQAPAAPVEVAALLASASAREATLLGPAQRMFQSACGACHHDGDGPQVMGLNHPLALNANLHSSQPDNLLRVIIEGIWQPAFNELGHMPAFGHALDDRQLAELAAYMRQRFAPGQAAWPDLPAAVARVRAALR